MNPTRNIVQEFPPHKADLRHFVEMILKRHQRDGGITEIRILSDVGTFSGYFDAHHVDELVKQIGPLRRAKVPYGVNPRIGEGNVYFTLQPVNPALLARGANRFVKAKRGQATGDGDIVGYSIFAVDVDPVRPAGISATDSEKQGAALVAESVRTWLSERGIECIAGDSGNGFHLLVPTVTYTDVNDAAMKAKALLALLAEKFNTDAATIDTTVYNASRIFKLYGTLAMKGDDVPDRPWRWSSVGLNGHVPADVDLFSILADEIETYLDRPTEAMQPPRDTQPAKNGDAWTRDESIRIIEGLLVAGGFRFERHAKSGREIFVFEKCPVHTDDDGHEFECCITVEADGRLGAKCQHDASVHWDAFRNAIHWDANIPDVLDRVRPRQRSAQTHEPRPSRLFNRTDTGNAERLAARHGNVLRYCCDSGTWLHYDGKRWNARTGAVEAQRLAIESARSIMQEAAALDDPDLRKALAKWSLSSESASRIAAVLSIAQNLPPIAVYSTEFDTDPYLLNCDNGTVDLRTGKLRPHDRADLITKFAPVAYDPNARSKVWEDHLTKVTGGNEALTEFLQQAAGYSATGDTSEEVLFLVHGPTAGGKTTTIETLKAALGDYAQTADFETFLKRNSGGGVRNDIAGLAGARMVVSVEVDEGKELAEGLVKLITGGDTVKARFLYKEAFEFKPQCKLWLVCNDAPRARDTDDALWRRILRVPFDYTIPKAERDPMVKKTLKDPATLPAILAWIVQGALKWKSTGLVVPRAVEDATAQLRDDQDPLHEFLEDVCEFDARAFVPVCEMRRAYEQHAEEEGIRYPLGPQEFNKRLEARGCERKTHRYFNDIGTEIPGKCWLGVTLLAKPRYDKSRHNYSVL